jgi:hypothetical protein
VAVLPSDPGVLAAMEREEPIGRRGTVRTDGDVTTYDPA